MKIILLSGGAGKRLWPLSSETRSKQFMQLSQDKTGRQLSMVQNTMHHLEQAGLSNDVLVTTSSNQLQQLRSQLGHQIQAAVEPERRDTFPAIMLAAAYLRSVLLVNEHETIIVLPVDHHVDHSFYQMLFQMDKLIQSKIAAIGLIGVKPSNPSSKFGYMVPSSPSIEATTAIPIGRFVEKPEEQIARQLIQDGALWNSGVFAFNLSYMLDQMHKRRLEPDYTWLLANYSTLQSVSFDYAVVEHEQDIAAIEYEGAWSDMGTWDSLTQTMEQPMYGMGLLDESCRNTHVVNELPIPLIVADLHDAVVVAGRDGILVTSRQAANDLKPLIENVTKKEKHHEGEVSFGWIRTLDNLDAVEHSTTAATRRIHLSSGKQMPYKPAQTTTWVILAGQAYYQSSNERVVLLAGQSVQPQTGSWLQAGQEDCELIEISVSLRNEN